MSERLVHIAVSINAPTARQVVCGMFSAAGARVQALDDAAAIIKSAPPPQAIVLELGAVPEGTFDAIVALRKKLAATPIFVIAGPEGQAHVERAISLGATKVVPRQDLHDRVGELVQQAAQASGIASWGIRTPPPVVRPTNTQPGYEIESIALDDWLSIPGNRRLLGMAEPYTEDVVLADSEEGADGGPGIDLSRIGQSGSQPSGARGEGLACTEGVCSQLSLFKAQHDAQLAAAIRTGSEQFARLEETLQTLRQDLQAHIETGLRPIIDQKVARSEANTHVSTRLLVDQAVAEARLESAAAIRRLHVIVGGLVMVLLLGAVALVSRAGFL